MSRRSRRRRIKIKLQARYPRDPKRTIDALMDAVQGPKSGAAQPTSPSGAPHEEFTQPLPDEQLETRVRQHAGQQLDQLDEQAKIANALVGKPTDAFAPAQPEEIVSRRRQMWQWTCATLANGYRITVEAVAKAYFDSMKGS